ncbi:MAG: sodium-dependent transporter [Phycisphaerae bacterium]|nr:sodium-dependent transporter [Phycisphaerae bacterium]
MSEQPAGAVRQRDALPELPKKENWGSKLGVVLAVSGSAVGLGNFLRFPGQAVNNGGGAFMIPYIISFLVLGIPIAWCEWTMGRLGGRFGQNSAPGIMYAIWRRTPAKFLGAISLLIPIAIYMYYILLEAWCLDYCIFFVQGGFSELFAAVTENVSGHEKEVAAVVSATKDHQSETWGTSSHGALFEGGRTVWLVLTCFLVNFFIIYQGVVRGIEKFCKWAMPLLILCAIIILVRVLTLPNITTGLGFMWNPQWEKLLNPQVWLAASGQIFFSLSVGFGLILCYSSYLRKNDDVVLSALSASSTNEFCEVILAGLIVVPTAFLFLGAENAKGGTFELGFVTVPAIMHYMPLGHWFGAMWFGLLFLAAVTSSLSMLQPAIAFLEDGFGLGRRASVGILGIVTALGAGLTMTFSRGSVALDHTDFWCNLCMIIAASGLVIIFGWVIGAKRGVKEMNRGADFHVPRFMAIMIRYITPAFLIIILGAWTYNNLPDYLAGMNPAKQGPLAAEQVASAAAGLCQALRADFADDSLNEKELAVKVRSAVKSVTELKEPEQLQPPLADILAEQNLTAWLGRVRSEAVAADFGNEEDARDAFYEVVLVRHLGLLPVLDEPDAKVVAAGIVAEVALTPRELVDKINRLAGKPGAALEVEQGVDFITAVRAKAAEARRHAMVDANIARFVFLGILLFFLALFVLSDVACRNRIGRTIARAEQDGVAWETGS